MGVRVPGGSHTLFCRHQQRVDVLEAFKLGLIDLLDHIPERKHEGGGVRYANEHLSLQTRGWGHSLVIRRQLDGLVGELSVEVVQSEFS